MVTFKIKIKGEEFTIVSNVNSRSAVSDAYVKSVEKSGVSFNHGQSGYFGHEDYLSDKNIEFLINHGFPFHHYFSTKDNVAKIELTAYHYAVIWCWFVCFCDENLELYILGDFQEFLNTPYGSQFSQEEPKKQVNHWTSDYITNSAFTVSMSQMEAVIDTVLDPASVRVPTSITTNWMSAEDTVISNTNRPGIRDGISSIGNRFSNRTTGRGTVSEQEVEPLEEDVEEEEDEEEQEEDYDEDQAMLDLEMEEEAAVLRESEEESQRRELLDRFRSI